MSGTDSSQGGLTRRSFLKTTGAIVGTTAVAGAAYPTLTALAEERQTGQPASSEERISQGICRPNCFGGCRLNVHVRDGKVVKTSMAPYPDEKNNRICLRGISHPWRIYDPERVKYPMRRAEGTERGAGVWERISWDDAINEIADTFMRVQEEYGPQAVAKWSVSGNRGMIVQESYATLFNAINASSIGPGVDMANAYGTARVTGWIGIWSSNGPDDLVNAKNIFLWGNNLTSAQLQEWHFVADALEAGSRLIVIDPIYTQIAAKADLWVPVRPGSDTALTLSMMNVIVKEDLVDKTFLQDHTVAPFLVRRDTGKFLRMSDLGIEPTEGPVNSATGKPTIIDPVAVMVDGSDAPVPSEGAVNPVLLGAFTIQGIECDTAYRLLCDEIAQYPPETACDLCEVPPETIIELAHYAADGPVTHRCGWGSQAYDNGVHTAHAGATLAGLVGQYGFPGASYGPVNLGVYPGFNTKLSSAAGASTSKTVSIMDLPEVLNTGKFLGKEYPIKAAFVLEGNPLSTATNTNALLDALPNLEFLVTADSAMTDTARYSDLVLPIAQWFECEDVFGGRQANYVVHNPKIIDPLYESKPDSEIVRLLADKMGLSDKVFQSDEEWMRAYIDTPAGEKFGITYDKLKEAGVLGWHSSDPVIRWEGGVFTTPSKRLEFYVETPTLAGATAKKLDVEREHLPRFFPPAEAWPENEKYSEYPFTLLSERSMYMVHSQWFGTGWLRELDPEPTVKINPAQALEKGIDDGAYVECYNDRGRCVARAVYSEAIKPGTLVYPKNWQRHQHKAGSWSELSSSIYDPAAVNQSFMDVLCDVKVWDGE
ncbi:molybdopterin-dependent oxidoreductase [Gordonibacter massiliensis (ex Traore et al. 2017)]|uniref:Molybdopterin-dependent oxidoreductase n=1 Tax=Gordonibacter massiliensis (ex Traore et al. 2017) TaxID=1841863 RepID=A0A842JLJ2_9ACTN|nr:molybdopterin-dependent oxidoreductase [Gordonibacter massiliensis (ex Traore et al. 2017)]MBC2890050.1 molybdopterin-dependent oxidoreductase [Gordonibacter massiliensis (ex Traore et al. 2017)]